jgi:hypothetical protein
MCVGAIKMQLFRNGEMKIRGNIILHYTLLRRRRREGAERKNGAGSGERENERTLICRRRRTSSAIYIGSWPIKGPLIALLAKRQFISPKLVVSCAERRSNKHA